MHKALSIVKARAILASGGVIAYPTEAVYGLGCDANNESAIQRLLALKARSDDKGLIVLIHDWSQLEALVHLPSTTAIAMQSVYASWPGFMTWVFPKSPKVSPLLTGQHEGIAIRMTQHPVAHALCQGGPIVSTSANLSGKPPARSPEVILAQFGAGIDGIVEGVLGGETSPSPIVDVLTGRKLR